MVYLVLFDDGSYCKAYFNETDAKTVAEAISGIVVPLTINSDYRIPQA